jgi:hypothetical protein
MVLTISEAQFLHSYTHEFFKDASPHLFLCFHLPTLGAIKHLMIWVNKALRTNNMMIKDKLNHGIS